MSKMMESLAKQEELVSVNRDLCKNRASPGWMFAEKRKNRLKNVTVVSSVRTMRQVKLGAVEVYYNHEMNK